MHNKPKPKKDSRYNIKSLHSSLIRSVYLFQKMK